VTGDETQVAGNAGKGARLEGAERREALAVLVLRRTKLTTSEARLFLDVLFPEIFRAHYDQVWAQFGRRQLLGGEIDDLLQETFLTFLTQVIERGLPDSVRRTLHAIAHGKMLNHVRAVKRSPLSLGAPSSRSEEPRSGPDLDRAMDLWNLAQRVLPQLSPTHYQAIDLVVLSGLSLTEAAAAAGIEVGTMKSRLMAAKQKLVELVEPLLPSSQRGT